MAYAIEFSPAAERQFRRLARKDQIRLRPHIDALADEPRPSGVKKLSNAGSLYRIRVGDFRIIYEIRDQTLLVLVLRVGNRRDVYRSIPELPD